jgi:hypothetical protein
MIASTCGVSSGGQALQHPGADQEPGAGGQAARQRGEGEQRQPRRVHPAPAEQVAQPTAGDDARRVGQADPAAAAEYNNQRCPAAPTVSASWQPARMITAVTPPQPARQRELQ